MATHVHVTLIQNNSFCKRTQETSLNYVNLLTNDESYIAVLIIKTTGHHCRHSIINHR